MAAADLTLYEYAVILQPKYDSDGNRVEEGRILVEPRFVLSEDLAQAQIIAGRAIPEEFIGSLERITLAVRPF